MPEIVRPASTPERQATRVGQRLAVAGGGMAVLLVAGLGAIIAYRNHNLPLPVDRALLAEMVAHRSAFLTAAALVLNNIGGGITSTIVALAISALLLLCRMTWASGYFAIATIVSASLAQLLKISYGRPRPQDILVTTDLGSFPSGHTANAATMTLVLALVLRRIWFCAAGIVYTVIMLLSRTYLGAHWLSDTIGGLVLGSAVAVIVWAPLAHRLLAEWESRVGPVRP